MSNGLPPSPPGAPPKPPPRRRPSPPSSEQAHNPFMVPEGPAPQPEEVSNPFLAQEPNPVLAPQVKSPPPVVPPSVGAPLRARPGVEAPNVRDAHAEFRKGGWKKPLAFGVIGAAVAGGLFFGMPEGKQEKPDPFAGSQGEPESVIGASVSPEVIPDPDRPSLQNPKPERRVKTEEELEQEQPPASPDRPDRSEGFADAFKSTAK